MVTYSKESEFKRDSCAWVKTLFLQNSNLSLLQVGVLEFGRLVVCGKRWSNHGTQNIWENCEENEEKWNGFILSIFEWCNVLWTKMEYDWKMIEETSEKNLGGFVCISENMCIVLFLHFRIMLVVFHVQFVYQQHIHTSL